MQSTLAVTALLMGVAGGPHCIAMCGAACAGVSKVGGKRTSSMWWFQFGRLVGYTAMGAFAAMSMQSLGWLSVHAAPFRPLWSLVHVSAALLGLMLLVRARQPVWLDVAARKIWAQVRQITGGVHTSATFVVGLLWCLLPCGLLYSALLVAALTSNVTDGAAVMALFAAGSGSIADGRAVALASIAQPELW